MKGLLQRALSWGKSFGKPIDYDESKRLVSSDDPAERLRVATNPEVKPEVLYFLATDPDPRVRTAVAANGATPAQADLILAGDGDEGVRADLARKIALLAPGLGVDETDRIRRMTYDVLETLARDQATIVRGVIAEALKHMPDAPLDIVQRLARDPELAVATPLLEWSPLLSDDDLCEIVRQLPVPGITSAIARRQSLSVAVADEIGHGNDIEAIAALLSNSSAQIREETLDELIGRAPQHPAWHRPLVDRPKLPDDAAKKLAQFVARDLIQRLRSRTDLKPETVSELQQIVMTRLDQDGFADDPSASEEEEADRLLAEVRSMRAAGRLDEETLAEALQAGQLRLFYVAIAELAAIPSLVIEKILSSGSAKGVTALIWRTGLSMRFAVRVQTLVARIPAAQVLRPQNDGSYPLSEEAMNWQIEFFSELGG